MNDQQIKKIRKDRWYTGPASLLTALLLSEGVYQTIRHRVIRPHASLKDHMGVNEVTIVGYPEIIDIKDYLIHSLPFSVALKRTISGSYAFVNGYFCQRTRKTHQAIHDTTERDWYNDQLNNKVIGSIRRTDIEAQHSKARIMVEEEAVDHGGNKHKIFTWKIQILGNLKREGDLESIAIAIVSLELNQLPI